MVTLKYFNFNPLQVNNYLVYDETHECVIVDATCYFESEKEELLDFIVKNGLKPVRLLNTHCHFDHIVGNKFVLDNFKIPLCAHKSDEFLLKILVDTSQRFGLKADASPDIDIFLKDGDIIHLGNHELEVLHVPGHSPGSLAFHVRRDHTLLSGDTLFNGSVGRTDLPGGSSKDLIHSIKTKLYTLERITKVYPGHGPSTTIGAEIDTNPFVK